MGICIPDNYAELSISHIHTYLDLPYGAYFCRCSKTVELSPFLRKNAVPENKCRCEKLSAHVVGYFRRLVGIFAVWSGIFAAEKRAWQQYIRRNSGLPKKVVLVENLFIGQKAEIKPTLEEAGIVMYICTRTIHNMYASICKYIYIYIYIHIYTCCIFVSMHVRTYIHIYIHVHVL